jgi:uncharacterized protein
MTSESDPTKTRSAPEATPRGFFLPARRRHAHGFLEGAAFDAWRRYGWPMPEFTFSALAPLVAVLVAAGVASGLLAGLFGVGGGAVLVPVLYQLFEFIGVENAVRMHLAVGTSLAIIAPTSIASYRKHRARGAVDAATLRIWAVPVVIGVVLGSAFAAFAPAAVLKLVFVVVAGATAAKLLAGRDDWRIAPELPSAWPMRAYGLCIGLFSALMGIGGGMIGNLVQTFHGVAIHRAVATSAGLGVLISIPGAIGYMLAGWPKLDQLPAFSLGYVSVIGFVIVAPLATLTAPFGVKLAHGLSKRRLEIAFGLFLLAVSARFVLALFDS